MSYDYIPATVYNDTPDLTLVIVDGDNEGQFAKIYPGSKSTKHFRSIDAFGAYRPGVQVQEELTKWGKYWDGPVSPWWKLPDGCRVIVTQSQGIYFLMVAYNIPGMGPSPSSAGTWNYYK